MTSIKLIILKYATLMLNQKTQHPFHNVGRSQNTVLCAETCSCSSGIFLPVVTELLRYRPPRRAPMLRTVWWTDVAPSPEIWKTTQKLINWSRRSPFNLREE